MEFKTGRFNQLMRAVDDTEKIYSPENFMNRGPDKILEEFNQMQLEAYKLQKDFFVMIQDARTIGVSDFAIKKKLKNLNVGRKMRNNLMKGIFTPVNYSEKRFEKKVDLVRRAVKERQKDNPDFNYVVDSNYLYPKLQLNTMDMNKQLYINFGGGLETCNENGDDPGSGTNYCTNQSIYVWGVQLERKDIGEIPAGTDLQADAMFEPSPYNPKYGGDFSITYNEESE